MCSHVTAQQAIRRQTPGPKDARILFSGRVGRASVGLSGSDGGQLPRCRAGGKAICNPLARSSQGFKSPTSKRKTDGVDSCIKYVLLYSTL
jgi:hypothetical protein